jgi:hypothetical protein
VTRAVADDDDDDDVVVVVVGVVVVVVVGVVVVVVVVVVGGFVVVVVVVVGVCANLSQRPTSLSAALLVHSRGPLKQISFAHKTFNKIITEWGYSLLWRIES